MNQTNPQLIALTILISYVAILLMFSLVRKLNKSLSNDKKTLMMASALTIGSCLWGIQVLNVLTIPAMPALGVTTGETNLVYTVGYVVLSWLAAFLFSAILLYTTSKATLPAKALSTGGVLAGISACAVFFFSIFSTQAEASILLTSTYSLLAVAASITLAIVGIMMLLDVYKRQRRLWLIPCCHLLASTPALHHRLSYFCLLYTSRCV